MTALISLHIKNICGLWFSGTLNHPNQSMYFNGFISITHQQRFNWATFTTLRVATRGSVIAISIFVMYGYSLSYNYYINVYTIIRRYKSQSRHPGHFTSIFLDNALFFFNMLTGAWQSLRDLLNRFCVISSQVISLQKSFIKCCPNIPMHMQNGYKHILNMDSHPSLGKYLGAPIDMQQPKTRYSPSYWTVSLIESPPGSSSSLPAPQAYSRQIDLNCVHLSYSLCFSDPQDHKWQD